MLRLPDSWVWDAWYVKDEDTYHVFFLYASRALHDKELRHRNASVGHAVSTDLRTWERVEDALVRGADGEFDDLATWTGSVVRGDDGRWYMFYTGTTEGPAGELIQRVGLAISDDLHLWHKHDANPVASPDPQLYEPASDGPPELAVHWRDPWVMRDPEGRGWHMLITAGSGPGAWLDRGVIGHATSDDLLTWTVQPPLSEPGAGFSALEVPQVEIVDGRPVLVVNASSFFLDDDRRERGPGGIWAIPAASPLGPFDVAGAYLLSDERLYVGKLLQDPQGEWVLIAFVNTDDGSFGALTDPIAVHWEGDQLTLDR